MSRSLTAEFAQAQKEADRLKDEYVSTEHLLLSLSQVKSEARAILSTGGVTHDAILNALNRTRWNRKEAAAVLRVDYKALLYKMKKLGIDRKPGDGAPATVVPIQN